VGHPALLLFDVYKYAATVCSTARGTHTSGSQLLEDGVEAAVKNGCIADSDRRRSPDELDRVRQTVYVIVVVVSTFYCNKHEQPRLTIQSSSSATFIIRSFGRPVIWATRKLGDRRRRLDDKNNDFKI